MTKQAIKTTKVKKPKSKNFYVDNKLFLASIKAYKQKCREYEALGKPKPPIPDFCATCLLNIANGLAHHHRFIRYTFREDLISDGLENALLYFDNFDEEKYNNPFTYYTTIMKYAFFRRIAIEEKNSYVKYKSYYLYVADTELEEQLREENTGVTFDGGYDNLLEFIDKFERRREEEKLERKRKKQDKMNVNESRTDDVDPGEYPGPSGEVKLPEPELQ